MKDLGIPVRMDRVRTLLLNAQALHLCRQTFCVDLKPEAFLRADLTLDLTRQLLWCGLVVEDRRLQFETVCRLVTQENYVTFEDAIARAVVRGIGASYQASRRD